MRKISIVYSVFLFVLLVTARAEAVTFINSLPFTCSNAGETYILSSDLTLNTGNAITVTANNVVIEGNGKSITYAVTGAGYGIYINSTVTSIEIRNLSLIQGGYDPVTGERVDGIYRNGDISGVKIHDNAISIAKSGTVANAYGYGINLANISNNSSGNTIYSNTISVSGVSGGRGISIDTSGSGNFSGAIYQNTITLAGITSVPAGYPSAISVGNVSGTVDIYSNNVTIDSASSVAQGIQFWKTSNSIVRNNTISMAGRNSRAILINGGSSNNEVYLNNITITSQNGENQTSAGIRVRYGSNNNKIYRNTIIATNAVNSFPIRYGGDEGAGIPTNNVFHHNILSSNSRVISIEGANKDSHFYANTITNTDTVNGYAIYIYGHNGEVIDNLTFSYEAITGKTIRITGISGETSTIGVNFCSSGLAVSDVSVGPGIHDWSITSSNCPNTPPTPPTLH